ncbi:MAG: PEP-CTERM sorting domain-containing protein [Burkholderiaceae bacterium]|nr:PEP-CTERM sorting domain-containing protein [Burkholderiaceae bacterium]
MSKLHGILLAAALCVSAVANAGVTDVSLGASVTEVGTTFGQSPGWGPGVLSAPGAITNGSFLPTQNQWDINTVYWTSNSDYVQVNLNGNYSISNVVLQADNNDIYQVSYLNNGSWTVLGDYAPTIGGTVNADGTITPTSSVGWGLGLNGASGQSITTTAFRIQAISGDNHYAVGQFQAYGVAAVPEPSTYAMMGLGLFAIAFARRRFKA